MSRYPLAHNHSAYVSVDQRKDSHRSRKVTLSCIDAPAFGLLHIANAHLSRVEHGFFAEYATLIQLARSRSRFGSRGELLVGDFNAPAGQDAYNHVVGNAAYVDQFYEAHPDRFLEPSCYGRIDGWEDGPARQIDYVFKRSGDPMRIQAVDVIFDGGSHPVVSDHFGYVARFALF